MAFSNHLGLDTEVRKLKAISPSHAMKLVQMLDENDSWKFLMSIAPKTLEANHFCEEEVAGEERKYSADHVRLIENAAKKDSRTSGEIFLFEWSTSGRQRATLGHLLGLLKRAQLYRAADYVAMKILNIEAPTRPTTGPAAKIDILQLDAELSEDEERSSDEKRTDGNVNENPQVSNWTIENNLDNSKPQNSHRRANIGKFTLPSASTARVTAAHINPLIEISEATASLNFDNNNCDMQTSQDAISEVSGIVLQTPQFSTSQIDNNENFDNIRPDLSGLLHGRDTNSSKEWNLNTDSISSNNVHSSSSVDSNYSINQNDSTRSNENINSSSNHVPCFSQLLGIGKENGSTHQVDSEYVTSSRPSFTPNFSELLRPFHEQKRLGDESNVDNSSGPIN